VRLAERRRRLGRHLHKDPPILRQGKRAATCRSTARASLLDAVLNLWPQGLKVQRYKGLWRNERPDQLWETPAPNTPMPATLLQVPASTTRRSDEHVHKLMGDVVETQNANSSEEFALEASGLFTHSVSGLDSGISAEGFPAATPRETPAFAGDTGESA